MGARAFERLRIAAPANAPRHAAIALFACALLAPATLPAQVRDTLRQRQDTLPVPDTTAAQDTVGPPPPMFAALPRAERSGWSYGVRVWNQTALLNEGALNLLDLLGGIPGVLPLRSGVFLQPEAATAFAGGGARTIVEIDGYVIDPLLGPSVDLSSFELAQLEEVRVERRMDVLHIRLRTAASRDARAYSRIEAGLGEPNTNLFRGQLLVPHFFKGPVGVAVERLEVQGAGTQQPAQSFAAWVKAGWHSDRRGLQFEFRNSQISRDAGSPVPLDGRRRDIMVRARNAFTENLVAELYAGRSSERKELTDEELPDSLTPLIERVTTQAGGRLGWQEDHTAVDGAVRWRNNKWLPQLEAEANATTTLLGRITLTGNAHWASWRDDLSVRSFRVHAQVSPLPWINLFGEATQGTRGAPTIEDSIPVPAWTGERRAVRAGAEARIGRLSGGGALIRITQDSLTTFGLLPDSAAPVVPGGEVTGWEAQGQLRLLGDWLFAAGHYTTWLSGTRWAYLPASTFRAALESHAVPLPSGNLEIIAQMEALHRGSMPVPPAAGEEQGPELAERTVYNAYLQIRIIDVRIFARLDDMTGQDVEDVRGLPVRGPRFVYGVKWNFWN